MMRWVDKYFIKRPKLRRWVTRLLAGDRELDLPLLGGRVRINTIKDHGYLRAARLAKRSALLRDELPVLLNLACLLHEGDTLVDIGANVGVYCLTLARIQRLVPNLAFYAFEANPDTFARLAVHTQRLGVIAHNVALSDHEGMLEFVEGADSKVFTTTDNASAYSLLEERRIVPCKRLDQFDLAGNSLILKIDVEGQERNVLEGARGLFSSGRVKAVYLDGYKDRTIEKFLKQHGFAFLEGRTLEPTMGNVFSLLAVQSTRADSTQANRFHLAAVA